MARFVSVDEVFAFRAIALDDDLEPLGKHVNDSGLQVPVVLTQVSLRIGAVYLVVDGLRRVRAVQQLGQTKILAEIATEFHQLEPLLTAAHQNTTLAREVTPRRLYELHRDLKTVAAASRTRPGDNIRSIVARIVGLPSGSRVQQAVRFYRMVELDQTEVGDRARAVLPLLESGAVSVHQATKEAENKYAMSGDLTKVSEQRAALTAAVGTIRGLWHGLDQMGPINPRMSAEEAKGYLSEFQRFRANLSRFVRVFAEEVNRK